MDEMTQKYLDVQIEEYKVLKESVSRATASQFSIISFGLTAISVLFGFSSTSWNTPVLAELLFGIVIPIITIALLLMWTGEVYIVTSTSKLLLAKEKVINGYFKKFNEPALSYETWNRLQADLSFEKKLKTGRIRWNTDATFTLVALLNLMGLVLGVFHLFMYNPFNVINIVVALFVTVVDLVVLLFLYRFYHKVFNNHLNIEYLVIDGGATNTRVLGCDKNGGHVYFKKYNFGLNYVKHGNTEMRFVKIFEDLRKKYKYRTSNIKSILFGLSGIDTAENKAYFENILQRHAIPYDIITNDSSLVAYEFGAGNGVGILCGSGSNIVVKKGKDIYDRNYFHEEERFGSYNIVGRYVSLLEQNGKQIPRAIKVVDENNLTQKEKKKRTKYVKTLLANIDRKPYIREACIENAEVILKAVDKYITFLNTHEQVDIILSGGVFNSDQYTQIVKSKLIIKYGDKISVRYNGHRPIFSGAKRLIYPELY